MTARDGVLTIQGGRLRFEPEVYPVAHLANEGWRKEGDVWTAPITYGNARRLRELFPTAEYSDEFMDWVEQAGGKPPQLLSPQRPPRWNDLYPYQQREAKWLAQQRSAILAIAPGLGKTAIALTAAQMAFPTSPIRVAVVCPLTLLGVWQRETKLWWPEAQTRVVTHHIDWALPSQAKLRVYLLTYDYLRLHGLSDTQNDLLIFDESVLLKNRDAKRAKAAALARKQAKVCWLLSGSPTTRFLDDLYMQLHVLEPREYKSYWRFAHSCTLVQDTIWGKKIVANMPGAEPRLKRDLAPIMHTYSYTDLAREEPARTIPEWVFETRKVPLPPAWWRLYKQMQDRFVADLPDGNRVLAPNVLARLVRLLQLASHPALLTQEQIAEQDDEPETCTSQDGESDPQDFSGYGWDTKGGKLAVVSGLLEELPGPVVIWTNFIATAKHLAGVLKAPLLIGETPADERTRIVAAFQAGEHPAIIAHPGVGRFGLTLTRGRSAIYVERSYDGDAWVQSLSRIRRLGTTEPPQVVVLEATGPDGQATVDRIVSRTLAYRKDRSEVLTTAVVKEALR